jgi:predicted CopG family antitoxin
MNTTKVIRVSEWAYENLSAMKVTNNDTFDSVIKGMIQGNKDEKERLLRVNVLKRKVKALRTDLGLLTDSQKNDYIDMIMVGGRK